MSRPGTEAALSSADKTKVVVLYALIGVATAAGFIASGMAARYSVALAGLGIVAYVLGLRHGVDADHIAAIDNTTRKLLQERRGKPLTVGTWFSLGHSTIVVGFIVALALATRLMVGGLPLLGDVGGVFGTAVSGTFLWLMGLVNAVIVLGVYRIFESVRHGGEGTTSRGELDGLQEWGFLSRLLRPLFRMVRRPWQIYPVGVLFGLGFDTASEMALIAVSVGVSSSVPVSMILVLPLMFTCGMVLADTTDGVLMSVAYGWAFLNPVRKVYYNLTVTVISVVVALGVGTAELLQVLSDRLSLAGPFWGWLASLDYEAMGLGIAVTFAAAWLVSVAVWKFKRFGEAPG